MQYLPTRPTERAVMLDTSAVYALWDEADQWHARAASGFHQLPSEQWRLYITNLTVAENHGLLLSRFGYGKASLWLDALRPLRVIYQTQEDHEAIRSLLSEHEASRLSYVDAFSCVAMQKQKLRLVFTFDRDFQDYGLEVFPGPLR
ncbi:MAG: type II toxin-antitoxin system VapC family toxin [Chloroflexi bacterium]|nr:type II toxin-antitoxin system VapC family toxin [Chloroflexota bacterium]